MHFYNEAYLLPWWCQHHYPLFDHGILIDYDSTDDSVEIIRQYCPGWEIRRSRNRYFGAAECDQEVVMIEAELSGWRMALNATEFLIGNFEALDDERRAELIIRSYTMVDPVIKGESEPRHDRSLLLQNHHGYEWPDRCARSLRQAPLGYPALGRHCWGQEPNSADFALLWYGFAPYNEHTIARKLQIQTRIPTRDVAIGFGKQHISNEGNLRRQILDHARHAANLKPLIDSFSSSRSLK